MLKCSSSAVNNHFKIHLVEIMKNLVSLTIISSSLLSFSVAAQSTGISEEAQLEIDQCLDGNFADCHEVGMRYDSGDDVPQDFEKSASYYAKGCQGGNSDACYNLAVAYDNGEGVQQDHAKAVSYFIKSCDAGDLNACFSLAISYDAVSYTHLTLPTKA